MESFLASKGKKAAVSDLTLSFLLLKENPKLVVLSQPCIKISLEPIVSEYICKHQVLPEAAEDGHFTFPYFKQGLSGRYALNMFM